MKKYIIVIINKLKDKLNYNIKMKISIVIAYVLILAAVIVTGTIYSRKMNEKYISSKDSLILKKDNLNSQNEEDKILEEKKEEDLKKEKINELKVKIQEIDPFYEFMESFQDIDEEIGYYEEVYKELLNKSTEEETNEQSDYYYEEAELTTQYPNTEYLPTEPINPQQQETQNNNHNPIEEDNEKENEEEKEKEEKTEEQNQHKHEQSVEDSDEGTTEINEAAQSSNNMNQESVSSEENEN
ncbi:hypothetical protein [Caproiciproducens sp. MSJ-32]|uniref:hypothetical protein n=1 Tax=Caproiciproducens sp. MSJ-32 TaxID=2841527 RepID=UPI001C123AE9|nr:hypothetical protein [Caproiciproducens sp. MSJ-32]MBU5454415.1 hypothetical protein [Caproiciproducens sp. MSJ-32]